MIFRKGVSRWNALLDFSPKSETRRILAEVRVSYPFIVLNVMLVYVKHRFFPDIKAKPDASLRKFGFLTHFIVLYAMLVCRSTFDGAKIYTFQISTIFFAKIIFYPSFLYSLGDNPVTRLKYFPKNDCDGKFSASLICSTVIFVDFNSAFASNITCSSICSFGGLPPVAMMTFERCFGVMHSLAA